MSLSIRSFASAAAYAFSIALSQTSAVALTTVARSAIRLASLELLQPLPSLLSQVYIAMRIYFHMVLSIRHHRFGKSQLKTILLTKFLDFSHRIDVHVREAQYSLRSISINFQPWFRLKSESNRTAPTQDSIISPRTYIVNINEYKLMMIKEVTWLSPLK
jgi:hypothetical protein